MSGRLAGKHCLITASAAGIGRATALAFAAEGARVLATDVDADALAQLAKSNPAIRTSVLDVTDAAGIDALVSSNEPFDVLFNCAGIVPEGDLLHTDEATWRRAFAVNVDSMYFMCRAVVPHMLARKRGSIINMSSVASSIRGFTNRFTYSATKAAVIGLTKAIAADYATQGIRCNAICPGIVHTPSLARRVAQREGDSPAAWKAFVERQAMGRLGKPEEIAALVVYLASDESSFTTGAVHVVDGGWTA